MEKREEFPILAIGTCRRPISDTLPSFSLPFRVSYPTPDTKMGTLFHKSKFFVEFFPEIGQKLYCTHNVKEVRR